MACRLVKILGLKAEVILTLLGSQADWPAKFSDRLQNDQWPVQHAASVHRNLKFYFAMILHYFHTYFWAVCGLQMHVKFFYCCSFQASHWSCTS